MIFEARELTKVYRMGHTEIHALRGVELSVGAGKFVVLLGPSGSGKSTLLNVLGERLDHFPSQLSGGEQQRVAIALVITHNAAIAQMADRVLRLGDGRIVREERPARKLTPSEISW